MCDAKLVTAFRVAELDVRLKMKFLAKTIFLLSGWLIAITATIHFGTRLDERDDLRQIQIDIDQISYFLWDYAQNHNGALPPSLEEGLRPYKAVEPLAGLFTLLTPNEQLFTLPANEPIVASRYSHYKGYDIVMYACGQTIIRPINTAEQGAAANP